MPNWCDNDLVVSAKPTDTNIKELKRFIRRGKTTTDGKINHLTTERFIPYPNKFRKNDKEAKRRWALYSENQKRAGFEQMSLTDKKIWEEKHPRPRFQDGFNNGGYEWCCVNWGTKWGICDARIGDDFEDVDTGKIIYHFDSAWCPPIPVIHKMSEMFPALKFKLNYYEQGMGYRGVIIFVDGNTKYSRESKYNGHRGG